MGQIVEVTQEGSPLVQRGRITRVGVRRMSVALIDQDGHALGSYHYRVTDGREAGARRHFPLRRVRPIGGAFISPALTRDHQTIAVR
ncbi:hypothetical protein ATL40_2759 [Serinibacter salmoneus]|uniref:Uncharacterized protein n=2 Tax=Serinibacter salmoneus TaxID=556530 RepID=A0A2A9D353_9MICO|nr:hypothetical protein ATL40_2759 [Serinibacter salmoneus]